MRRREQQRKMVKRQKLYRKRIGAPKKESNEIEQKRRSVLLKPPFDLFGGAWADDVGVSRDPDDRHRGLATATLGNSVSLCGP